MDPVTKHVLGGQYICRQSFWTLLSSTEDILSLGERPSTLARLIKLMVAENVEALTCSTLKTNNGIQMARQEPLLSISLRWTDRSSIKC